MTKTFDIFANADIFFNVDVNTPAMTRIIPWPKANKNNINIAASKFLPIAANAIIPAKIGVEQGVPASANTIPKSIGYKNPKALGAARNRVIVKMYFIIVRRLSPRLIY